MNFCDKCGSPAEIFNGKYCLCESCLTRWLKYWKEFIDPKDREIMMKNGTTIEIIESNRVWEREFKKFLKFKVWSVS